MFEQQKECVVLGVAEKPTVRIRKTRIFFYKG